MGGGFAGCAVAARLAEQPVTGARPAHSRERTLNHRAIPMVAAERTAA